MLVVVKALGEQVLTAAMVIVVVEVMVLLLLEAVQVVMVVVEVSCGERAWSDALELFRGRCGTGSGLVDMREQWASFSNG